MDLLELIDFHRKGAEACEAFAPTEYMGRGVNRDMQKHYAKRAEWHRGVIAMLESLECKRSWTVCRPGAADFLMVADGPLSRSDALKSARVRWPDAQVR